MLIFVICVHFIFIHTFSIFFCLRQKCNVLEEEELIVDEQNRFRSGRSCQDHIFVLDSVIRNRLAEDIPTFTAFIDLQKAFDCVNRDLLLNKILANGIDSKVFLAIKSLYSYTEVCVKLPGGLYIDWFQTSFGVKQGDTLSPTLFSVFLNAKFILKKICSDNDVTFIYVICVCLCV